MTEPIITYPVDGVTIEKAAEITGLTENAIRNKISLGMWAEGKVWKWGQDNRQYILLKGYNQWLKLNPKKASRRGRVKSASRSTSQTELAAANP